MRTLKFKFTTLFFFLFSIINVALTQEEVEINGDGIILPRTDTTQVNTPDAGQLIYQSNANKLFYFNGTNWIAIEGSEYLNFPSTPQSSPVPGEVRFNTSKRLFEGWDGERWVRFNDYAIINYGTVSDIDGNVYKTIEYDNGQEWMIENLRVTKYNNGDIIPEVTSNNVWKNLTTHALCSIDNDSNNDMPYGKLYNGYVISDSRNVCPSGWDIPTEPEIDSLMFTLGGTANLYFTEVRDLRTEGTEFWNFGGDNTNSTGFSLVGTGSRDDFTGWFINFRTVSNLHIQNDNGNLKHWVVYEEAENFILNTNGYQDGYAIRCIKD